MDSSHWGTFQGQAPTHARQPTQSERTTCTRPSSGRLTMAPVGHTATHQGVSQWKQGRNAAVMRGAAASAGSEAVNTSAGRTAGGVRVFTWHCTSQAPQPMQRSGSSLIM